MPDVKKGEPTEGYPTEEGSYLRGNDFSPVAVAVILVHDREKTPPEIQSLVQIAVESGAALAGTIQTENIGIEKVVCNLVGNPNIRYLVVCGPESPGHSVGEALIKLSKNGIDERRRIIDAGALTPYLFNISSEAIHRFREQITVIDLINEGSPALIREVVRACYQEHPASFRDYQLWDPGAFPAPPLSTTLSWRVKDPTKEPKNEVERAQKEQLKVTMAKIKAVAQAKRKAREERKSRLLEGKDAENKYLREKA